MEKIILGIKKLYLAPWEEIEKLDSQQAKAIWENRQKINEIIDYLNNNLTN